MQDLVACYFAPASNFAGASFDALGCNDLASITIDDLLAITCLDVRCKPHALRILLYDETVRANSAALLRKIPTDIDIWNTTDFGAANELWQLLEDLPDVGPVIAGKILARKRPRLIPIVDQVVQRTVPCPANEYWKTFGQCLVSEERRTKIENLRPQAVDVSTVRLLDVVIWMRGSRSRSATQAREDAGVPHPS